MSHPSFPSAAIRARVGRAAGDRMTAPPALIVLDQIGKAYDGAPVLTGDRAWSKLAIGVDVRLIR